MRSAGVESRLTRLAVVFADPIRLKIVTELNMREMSPTQFFEVFGGGDPNKVNRHFRKLAEFNWLRLVRKGVGDRGGRPQHFYRSTELAIFDSHSWAQLPYSMRAAFSLRSIEQFAERVAQAVAAGTFDSRENGHLSSTPVILDSQGWVETIRALDACFEALAQEQADAKLRLARSQEAPILTTVALAGFESPQITQVGRATPSSTGARSARNPIMRPDSPMPFSMRVARVFADPLSLKIVTELNGQEMSASQLKQKLPEGSLEAIHRRLNLLSDLGWLVKVDEKTGGQRRGATEHFYRAVRPASLESDMWAEVPGAARTGNSWQTLGQFAEKVTEALQAGTLDSRLDRHVSWSLLLLDELGWNQVVETLDRFYASLFSAQEAAKLRLAAGNEDSEPMSATFFLAAFESSNEPLS